MPSIISVSIFKRHSINISVFLTIIYSLLQSSAISARDVKIAIGLALPPYVIKENKSGLEVEIIREAFRAKGHNAKFDFITNLRIPLLIKKGMVDGTAINKSYNISKDVGIPIYGTDTTIKYKNYAISFKYKKFKVRKIEDLADKRVISFQNAKKYLGPVFAKMASDNSKYKEHAQQSLHVRLLYKDSTDVVVSDKRIFLYWRDFAKKQGLLDKRNIAKDLEFYDIFPFAPRNLKLREEKLRDDFNKGLKIIHTNGVYNKLIKKYKTL